MYTVYSFLSVLLNCCDITLHIDFFVVESLLAERWPRCKGYNARFFVPNWSKHDKEKIKQYLVSFDMLFYLYASVAIQDQLKSIEVSALISCVTSICHVLYEVSMQN